MVDHANSPGNELSTTRTNPEPVTVRITFSLIFMVALVWVLFGVIVVARLHPALPDLPIIRWGIGLTAVLAGALLAVLDILLFRRNPVAYWALVVGLIILALANLLDQFGWIDLLIMALTLIPVALLIRDRKWYLKLSTQA